MHRTRVRAVVEADEGLNSTRISERSGAEEKISRKDFTPDGCVCCFVLYCVCVLAVCTDCACFCVMAREWLGFKARTARETACDVQ